MPCKASPIGPLISVLIEDVCVNLAPTILSIREGGVSQITPPEASSQCRALS